MHLKKILAVLSLFFLFHNFHIPKFRIPFHSLLILQAQTQTVEIEEALSGFDESESDPSSEEADLLSGFDEEEPEIEQTEIVPEEKGWLSNFSGKAGALALVQATPNTSLATGAPVEILVA